LFPAGDCERRERELEAVLKENAEMALVYDPARRVNETIIAAQLMNVCFRGLLLRIFEKGCL
jgi:hypothetical protein